MAHTITIVTYILVRPRLPRSPSLPHVKIEDCRSGAGEDPRDWRIQEKRTCISIKFDAYFGGIAHFELCLFKNFQELGVYRRLMPD